VGVAAAELAEAGGIEVQHVAFVGKALGGDEGDAGAVDGELGELFVDHAGHGVVVLFASVEELAEFADDDGYVAQVGAERFHDGEPAFLIGADEFKFGAIGFALVPEDATETAVFHGHFGAANGVGIELAAGLPFIERAAAHGGGDEADFLAGGEVGEGLGEGAAEAGAEAVGPVEVDGFDGGGPGFLFGEGEDTRMGDFVLLFDDAAAGHVGLADEQEQLHFLGAGGEGEGEEEEAKHDPHILQKCFACRLILMAFTDVDTYLAGKPEALSLVRSTIRRVCPEAVESIAYNMPAYKLQGEVLIYFAAWKKHYSLYPVSPEMAPGLVVEKATVRFSYAEPVPVALIEKIVAYRVREAEGKRG